MVVKNKAVILDRLLYLRQDISLKKTIVSLVMYIINCLTIYHT